MNLSAFGVFLITKPNPIETILRNLTSMNIITHKSTIILGKQSNRIALSITGMFGYQVDHTVYRISAPNRCTRSANYFDSVNYCDRIIVHGIVGTSINWVTSLPPIFPRNFWVEKPSKISHRGKIVVWQSPTNMHPWYATQTSTVLAYPKKVISSERIIWTEAGFRQYSWSKPVPLESIVETS